MHPHFCKFTNTPKRNLITRSIFYNASDFINDDFLDFALSPSSNQFTKVY